MSKKMRGLSLVEVMVASAIFLTIMGCVLYTFVFQQRSSRIQDLKVQMQQNTRTSLEIIKKELRMAGLNIYGYNHLYIGGVEQTDGGNPKVHVGKALYFNDADNDDKDVIGANYLEADGKITSAVLLDDMTAENDNPIKVNSISSDFYQYDKDNPNNCTKFPFPALIKDETDINNVYASVFYVTNIDSSTNMIYHDGGVADYSNNDHLGHSYPADSTITKFSRFTSVLYRVNDNNLERKWNSHGWENISPDIESLQCSFGLDTNNDGFAETDTSGNPVWSNDLTGIAFEGQIKLIKVALVARSGKQFPALSGKDQEMDNPLTEGVIEKDGYLRFILTNYERLRNL